jgi:hypothetical protein
VLFVALILVVSTAVPVAAQVGTVRFLLHRSDPRRDARPGFTAERGATLAGLELQTISFVAAAVCDAWAKSAAEAHIAGNFGSRPLIVLTAGRAFAVRDPQADEELKAFMRSGRTRCHSRNFRPRDVRLSWRTASMESDGKLPAWC